MRLPFQGDRAIERCSSGAIHEEVQQSICGPIMSTMRITRKFKSRQKADNRYRVERIDYLGFHLPLQTLGQFSDASSNFFFTMRRVIRQVVYSVVESFLEAVFEGADYQVLFVTIALDFSWRSADESGPCCILVFYDIGHVPYVWSACHPRALSLSWYHGFPWTILNKINVVLRLFLFVYYGLFEQCSENVLWGCFLTA